jgi:hypothetical protein
MRAALASLQPEYWRAQDAAAQALSPLALRARNVANNLNARQPVKVRDPSILTADTPFMRETRIALALNEIAGIPEGAALVSLVKSGAVTVDIDNTLEVGGRAWPPQRMLDDGKEVLLPGKVLMNGNMSQGEFVLTLMHELQHQRQFDAGLYGPQSKIVSPVETVWYDRAIEADAQATAVDLAWKLKQAGKPAAWDFARSDTYNPTIPAAYERAALADPQAVADGHAKRAAYDQWFVEATMGGDKISTNYGHQGLKHVWDTEDVAAVAAKGTPLAPMTQGDIQKLGDLSPVNYLKMQDQRAVDDVYYRAPDWNAAVASGLHKAQDGYDALKEKLANQFRTAAAHPAMQVAAALATRPPSIHPALQVAAALANGPPTPSHPAMLVAATLAGPPAQATTKSRPAPAQAGQRL